MMVRLTRADEFAVVHVKFCSMKHKRNHMTSWLLSLQIACFSFVASSCVIDTGIIPNTRCSNGPPLPLTAALVDSCRLEANSFFENETNYDAVVVFQGQELIYQWGDISKQINTASVRKSILSALYGIAIEKGLINLDATLSSIGIDDSKQPLTPQEREATVRMVLQSRSGIYLRSLGESSFWADRRPERGSYAPGTHWFYNNWDFNILGVIFERQTGIKLGDAIYQWLAVPLGMQDFCPEHVRYEYADFTEHPIQRIYMSAGDLARFGALYLDDGRWQGKQILPPGWVEDTYQPYSNVLEVVPEEVLEYYGYLWWGDSQTNTWWAVGSGGQVLIVDRANQLVSVGRNNTGTTGLGAFWYELTDNKEADALQLLDQHHRFIACLQ
jgi:hypothetical protein